jgi:hypothetical protein
MFGKDNKVVVQNLSGIRATSKLSLKMTCLAIAEGDLEKATKMYEFFAADMELPDTDPVPPTKMQTIKASVEEVSGLIKNNKDEIMDLVGFGLGIVGKKTPTTSSGAANIPPLPN